MTLERSPAAKRDGISMWKISDKELEAKPSRSPGYAKGCSRVLYADFQIPKTSIVGYNNLLCICRTNV